MTQLLILGGTGEARQLATRLATRDDLQVTVSLAGRTRAPEVMPCDTRIGGFGGADGLARYLRERRIGVLIDATHPFAARIARNAAEAAGKTGVPLITLMRPAWQAVAGDNWLRADSMAKAVRLLGDTPRRVFLAIGRQDVGVFRDAPQHHYVIRSVEPIEAGHLPSHVETILARGPFSEAGEQALLAGRHCDVVVAKNSGGSATYGKIAAARALRLPIIMIERPKPTGVAIIETVEAAERLIDDHLAGLPAERGA